jgi:hypothetical protein
MGSGSFYNFSSGDFFNNINAELLIFALTFLLLTALFRWALIRKAMKNNPSTASVVAVCLSLGASYGLMSTGISFAFLEGMQLTPEFLVNVLPWLILLIAAAIIIKWEFGTLLIIFGTILFVSGFFNLIDAKGFGTIGGATIILVGIILRRFIRRRRAYKRINLKDREMYKGNRRANRRPLRNSGGRIRNPRPIRTPRRRTTGRRTTGGRAFGYKAGMRRGGTNTRKHQYVSKLATQRYARKYGTKAAGKRFKT